MFAASDHGDHHRLMARGWGHQNIIYSTPSVPTDLNNEADIAFSKENEVRLCITLCLQQPYLSLFHLSPGDSILTLD